MSYISKLKESWFIFKNAKDKFDRDKNYASGLVERASHLKCITEEAWFENSKFLDFITTNLEKYPKDIREHLKCLISFTNNEFNYHDYVYNLLNVFLICNNHYKFMKQNLENKDFVSVKERYDKLINDLKGFEEKFSIKIFDNHYIY